MRTLTLSLFILLIAFRSGFGQNVCRTDIYRKKQLSIYTPLKGRSTGVKTDSASLTKLASLKGIITIPLSIHVRYHYDSEHLTRAMIEAQVAQLNKDFSGINEDRKMVPDSFKRFDAGDCGIRFVIKKLSIKYTWKKVFMENRQRDTDNIEEDQIKFTKLGGENGDADNQFLNIWIGNIKDGSDNQLKGYSTLPGGIDKYDGVVIYYGAVGPDPSEPCNKGRTLTHEVGHWLNLNHLWGDDTEADSCGDDSVKDTPLQSHANYDFPIFPHRSCDSEPNGDMYVNFMDYTVDTGRFMFTQGQKDRMRLNFVEHGARASFVYNPVINDLAKIDTGVRGDAHTPVISYVKDLTVKHQFKGKTIIWRQQTNVKNYIVQSRIVGSVKWDTVQTTTKMARLGNLVKNQIYEVKIQKISTSGIKSTASQPFIFKNKPVSAIN